MVASAELAIYTRSGPGTALVLSLVLLMLALPAGAERSWLQVESPATPDALVGTSLIEVSGYAGARGAGGHDLVLVLDLSDSTIHSSGLDLDGDGPDGRTDPVFLEELSRRAGVRDGLVERLAEIDFEDSILAAELAAAEALIERLDPRSFRVGLVIFSDEAWLVAPLGASRERLDRVLGRVRRTFFRDLRGTHFADAVRIAHRALTPDPALSSAPRERSILFLSDGAPTLPVHGNRAEESALSAARAAAEDGIRLYAFALGDEAVEALDVYRDMALVGGGRLERIELPGEAIARLRRVDLADLAELRITNLTTAEPVRALRTFPDGSFDGFVTLAPGENRLRFSARAADGTYSVIERSVSYDRDVADTGSRRELQSLLDELRRRTRETALWAEVERRRHAQGREMRVEAERELASP